MSAKLQKNFHSFKKIAVKVSVVNHFFLFCVILLEVSLLMQA